MFLCWKNTVPMSSNCHSLILKDSQPVYSRLGSKRLQLLVHPCKVHDIIYFIYSQIQMYLNNKTIADRHSQGKGYIHRKCSIWQNFSFLINFRQCFPYGCNMICIIKLRIKIIVVFHTTKQPFKFLDITFDNTN